MRVLHVITGLRTGGAEMMLFKLLSAVPDVGTSHRVVALTAGGSVAPLIEDLGVAVASPNAARGRLPGPMAVWHLGQSVRRFSPDVVQGWMYHGNLAAHAGVLASGRRCPVVWNVRSTLGSDTQEKPATSHVIRIGARLSGWPARIVYPSRVAAVEHEAIGYSASRREIIGNGFDLERLRPSADARRALRADLGLEDGTVLIGHVARFHPMKNHAGLLQALAAVRDAGRRVRLVMIGHDVDKRNATLTELIARLDLRRDVSLLGERSDTAALTAGFDVAVSASSWGEAFPNVLGEAMACGVACVATDVGDSAEILGDSGVIVRPDDRDALASAIERLIDVGADGRRRLGEAARQRVVARYSLPAIVAAYEALWHGASRVRRSAA